MIKRTVVGGLIASLILLSGCGKSGVGSVSGTVTYKGNPVTRGSVELYPKDAGGNPAASSLDASGRYFIKEVKYGSYDVAINAYTEPSEMPQVPSGGALKMQDMNLAREMEKKGANIKPKPTVPEKYLKSKESGLSVNVNSGAVKQDFPLTD